MTCIAGVSLNEPPPRPNYNNWPSIFWRLFLVVTLLTEQQHTSARRALKLLQYVT